MYIRKTFDWPNVFANFNPVTFALTYGDITE